MIHATEGTLQAFLDEEVGGSARAEIAGHLEACASCRAELQQLQATSTWAQAALALLDQPAPVAHARQRILERQAVPARRRRAGWGADLARAAILVVALAGVAAAAIPGSPVREWLSGAWDRVSTFFAGEPAPAVVEAPPPAEAPFEALAAIALANGQVRIMLEVDAVAPEIQVRLVDIDRAIVYSADPATQFDTGAGRIAAAALGSGPVVVDVPRRALAATIEVNGHVAVVKDGLVLRARVPVIEDTGTAIRFRPQL